MGRSRGFGFVTFGSEKAKRDAIEGINSQNLDDRNITVSEAQSRKSGRSGDGCGEGGGGGYGDSRSEGYGNGGGGGGYGGNGGGGYGEGRERGYGGDSESRYSRGGDDS